MPAGQGRRAAETAKFRPFTALAYCDKSDKSDKFIRPAAGRAVPALLQQKMPSLSSFDFLYLLLADGHSQPLGVEASARMKR